MIEETFRLNLENRLNFLVKNNLKFDMNFKIPLKICSKQSNRWFARIYFLKKAETPKFTIYDQKNDNIFIPYIVPELVEIQGMLGYLPDNIIDQLLLHELNHWYSAIIFKNKTNLHGKEFKNSGIILGIHKDFLGASFNPKYLKLDLTKNIPNNLNFNKKIEPEKPISFIKQTTVYLGICKKCGKNVLYSEKRSNVFTKLNNPNYLSECCNVEIEYGGRISV